MVYPHGPDVSAYQGVVDWKKVRASGVGFAAAKASEGAHTRDVTFARNWKGMRAAGIPVRFAYHYAHPENASKDDAANFVNAVGKFNPGECAMLDIEFAGGQTAAHVAQWCANWCAEVSKLTGLPPHRIVVYTGAWFWNPSAGGSNLLAGHPLWISGYVSDFKNVTIAAGWKKASFWQYTDKETYPGISKPCDSSKFLGPYEELHVLAGLPKPKPLPIVPAHHKPLTPKQRGFLRNRVCAWLRKWHLIK